MKHVAILYAVGSLLRLAGQGGFLRNAKRDLYSTIIPIMLGGKWPMSFELFSKYFSADCYFVSYLSSMVFIFIIDSSPLIYPYVVLLVLCRPIR